MLDITRFCSILSQSVWKIWLSCNMFDSIEAYIHLHLYERKQGFSPTRMHFRSKDLITCGYPPFFYTSCDEFMCVLCCSHILCCCRGTAESGVALKPPLLTPSSYVFKSPFFSDVCICYRCPYVCWWGCLCGGFLL